MLPLSGLSRPSSTISSSVLQKASSTRCDMSTPTSPSTSTLKRIWRLACTKLKFGMSRATDEEDLCQDTDVGPGTSSARRLCGELRCTQGSMWKHRRTRRTSFNCWEIRWRMFPRALRTFSRYVESEIRTSERFAKPFTDSVDHR